MFFANTICDKQKIACKWKVCDILIFHSLD